MNQPDAAEVCRLAQNVARNTGWHVFPCRDNKAPATPHGFKDATNDLDALARLWTRHPGEVIGVATGVVSGVAVLDVDVKHDAARAWWFRNEHRITTTRTFRTRSGGLHLFFNYAIGIRCASGRPVVGVDVRGDGGYVIYWFAAGHECLDHVSLRPFPAWLWDAIWPPLPRSLRKPERTIGTSGGAINGILRTLSDATNGERNSTLYWAARRIQDRIAAGEIDRSRAERDLLYAARQCGLTDLEAERTIASAWKSV